MPAEKCKSRGYTSESNSVSSRFGWEQSAVNGRDDTDKVTIGKAVETLQQEFPDVTVSSLRFLEREGLVTPQRKPGGHRLYGHTELDRIRRIKRWQADRISLNEIRDRLHRAPSEHGFETIVENMTSSLFNNHIDGAMAHLWDVHQSGVSLLDICDAVLTPVLLNLGDDAGNHLIPVDVQMEFDQRLIAFLSVATSAPASRAQSPVIVAACPPWERHDMPLRMLVALLTERGASVHFMGAQVDSEFVRGAIERLQPDFTLISLTVQPPEYASTWLSEITSSMNPPQPVVAGGMSSPSLEGMATINLKILGTQPYAVTLRELLPDRF